jgi:NADH-quinone oxidoreductase subunit A
MRRSFRQLALSTLVDIGVFFAVLMVGFFYVWRRGDLDWVRAVGQSRAQQRQSDSGMSAPQAVSV